MMADMKPFFSIIIPTLNEEKFVGKLLLDLTKQKYKNFEVIVVDAYSEDKTLAEVQRFDSALTISKIIKIAGRNVSKQRNKGAQSAKAPYLVFIDADARIRSSFL